MLVDPELAAEYERAGYWGRRTLSSIVGDRARTRPAAAAYLEGTTVCTWADYDELADLIGAGLLAAGLAPGDRVAVFVPDGALVHALFLAAERAGLVTVGIGTRAGDRELAHLLRHTGAAAVVTPDPAGGELTRRLDALDVPSLRLHVMVDAHGRTTVRERAGGRTRVLRVHADRARLERTALGPNDLFLLNSTSGTTGLPKCVTQFQNRWFYFHTLAARAGQLGPDDVFMSLLPAPFGFGLWTAHFTPTILGVPTVVTPRFSAEEALDLVERHRVTVLCCVSTQFLMMLQSPAIDDVDLSSLRVMFTGGEAVPPEQAARFEDRTGAAVLQFYGSNETGALSCTTLRHTREQRLRTAGQVIPEMRVRVFDGDGTDVTALGGPGQPAARGPALCAGYFRDEAANRELFTDDGWMLMGDVVTVDDDGFLTVIGRMSDFIVRGGKNLSAAQIEAEVGAHPAVDLVAAVAVPDPVFGERVGVVVTTVPGAPVDLDSLCRFLEDRGVGKELWPEHLAAIDEMPRSSGGKIAKGLLRDRRRELFPSSGQP
ncbi:MAG TPA: class I adenylate-forming enzyme family protein [Acidimicrobiia bacterium]